ncbi:MAG TPA: hypothetical protein VFP59_17115 [Candidatus Angelobacter sp.]|nr:hypothetical protein [Candidatus Angelobacter sp.]
MPLARILTRFPEQAGALSQELRQHGYTVEFSTPELSGKPPADLEIDFEICAEPDALSRAAELAEQFHADVAISPGVLQRQDVRQEPEPLTAESLPERLELPVAKAAPATEPAEEPVWEPEPLPSAAETITPEEPEEVVHANVVPIRGESFESQQAPRKTAVDDELDLVNAATPTTATGDENAHEETATELLARMGEKSATLLHAAGVAGQQAWGMARNWTNDLRMAATRLSQEGRERLNVRKEEWKAQHQQKLLDLEKRRVLAQERAAELEAAREAAAIRLQELLRERGGLVDAQPAPPQKIVNRAPVFPAAAAAEWFRRIRIRFARPQSPQMQAVIMGVAAACLLFVVGLAVASFHARPAISSTIQQPTAVQPGYNGVTVQSGGVTVHTGAPTGATASTAPASPPLQAETRNPAAAQHSRTSDVTIRNFTAARKPSPARAGGSEHIGNDVTIRHFTAQGPARSAPRAELKHYSDLSN